MIFRLLRTHFTVTSGGRDVRVREHLKGPRVPVRAVEVQGSRAGFGPGTSLFTDSPHRTCKRVQVWRNTIFDSTVRWSTKTTFVVKTFWDLTYPDWLPTKTLELGVAGHSLLVFGERVSPILLSLLGHWGNVSYFLPRVSTYLDLEEFTLCPHHLFMTTKSTTLYPGQKKFRSDFKKSLMMLYHVLSL